MADVTDNDLKTDDISSTYTHKLENITKIRQNLEKLIDELNRNDATLSKGFKDIELLIDDQRKKFNNLSNQFEKAQQKKQNPPPNDSNDNSDDTKYNNNENDNDSFDIKLDSFDNIPQINNIELPPKRKPIEILPFEKIEIDYDLINKQLESVNNAPLEPEDDAQFDDMKIETEDKKSEFEDTDDTENDEDYDEETEEEFMDEHMLNMLENEKSENLLSMDIPKEVSNVLGNNKKFKPKMVKKKKDRAKMERDLRKITAAISDLDENERKYAKLSILKYYDILYETFVKYCKIGGDNDWLTEKGWIALYKDAFIMDKKSENCNDKACKSLFKQIYDSHHTNRKKKTQTHQKNLMTTALNVAEWNDNDPWTGYWKQDKQDTEEEYIIKQIGDVKLIGFIKSFDFCDINGVINAANRKKAQLIIFWHEGARKGRRRKCICTLKRPEKVTEDITMTVKWNSLDANNNEEGTYTMKKFDMIPAKYDNAFKYAIGLARHEYFDAMLYLSKLKYPELNNKMYESLCKLCEEYLIPYIWGSMENAKAATIKAIFRPHSTELHKLFGKCVSINASGVDDGSSDKNLLGLDGWIVMCNDIFKKEEKSFKKGGKPSDDDIVASFELAKEKFELELTYKGFETALQNLAHKIYKKKPKMKYSAMKFDEKLKKLLKWASKLQKAGYQPTSTKK